MYVSQCTSSATHRSISDGSRILHRGGLTLGGGEGRGRGGDVNNAIFFQKHQEIKDNLVHRSTTDHHRHPYSHHLAQHH